MTIEVPKKTGLEKPTPELAVNKPPVNKPPRHPSIEAVWKRSYEEGADFIAQHIATSMLFDTKNELHDFSFRDLPADGLILEFGVYKASSINRFAKILMQREDLRPIYGFDAFAGLSEDWVGHAYPKLARFDQKGALPAVRDNVKLIKGWVDDTLPEFLAENPGNIAFLHIDTDTYAPAKTILELCRDRLVPGTVVIFDELLGYPGWRVGEYKALVETIPAGRYEYIGFSGYQALIRIIK